MGTVHLYMKESERSLVESHSAFGQNMARGMFPMLHMNEQAQTVITLMAAMHVAKVTDAQIAGNEVSVVYIADDEDFPSDRVGMIVLANHICCGCGGLCDSGRPCQMAYNCQKCKRQRS